MSTALTLPQTLSSASRQGDALPPLVSRGDLLPSLTPRARQARALLSDDGYFDSVVSLGLCQGLDMTLRNRAGRRISHRALDYAGLGTHEAWTLAARNVLESTLTERGYLIRTRESLGGVQLHTPGAPTTAWLAHPMTFRVLHQHVARVLRTTDVVYLAPDADALWAVRAVDVRMPGAAGELFAAAVDLAEVAAPRAAQGPLVWSHGFPRPL